VAIYYVRDIPEVVAVVKGHFLKVPGLKKEPYVNIRVCNNLIVYVFVDADAAKDAPRDLVFPPDVGITYKDAATNLTKLPRLWLEERLAELRSERDVRALHPDLHLEFVTFLAHGNGRVTPLVD